MLLRKSKVYTAVMLVIGCRDDYKSEVAIRYATSRLTQAADSLGYALGSPMALKGLNVLCH